MKGSSVDRDKMAQERSLAEGLVELPDTALSEAGLIVKGCRTEVLKTSLSRPILRYAVTCSVPGKDAPVRRLIIGKGCYRHDGAKIFGFMKQLWSKGFAEDRRLTIPEPIAYLPGPKLLLQGRAPGRSLYEHIGRPAKAVEPVALTARWLAKLHGSRVEDVPVLPMEYEESKLRAYRDILAELRPGYAPRVEDCASRILSVLGALDPGGFVPTHGDFQPKNVFVSRRRATVIDFDRFALAHPARDLGHFVGQSMTMSYARTGSFREIEPWISAFLGEYARRAERAEDALSAVPIFVARTFMEVMKHKIFLDPEKNSHLLPVWLSECERWLEKTWDPEAVVRMGSRPPTREEQEDA